jgi:hypothetical protein
LLAFSQAEAYVEAAAVHSKSGVDVLFLEMMKNEDHAPRAVKVGELLWCSGDPL